MRHWAYLSIALLVQNSIAHAENGAAASVYEPAGKRDPFQLVLSGSREGASTTDPLQSYPLESFQLKAILKGQNSSQIMVEAPNGNSYILREEDTLGRNHAIISRILDSEVIFTERTFNYLGVERLTEKILSLSMSEDEIKNEMSASPSDEVGKEGLTRAPQQAPGAQKSVDEKEKEKLYKILSITEKGSKSLAPASPAANPASSPNKKESK
ncbi:MAG: hypothetical protein EB078_05940 [Proteobacteria bacterium]|nr:hypothetical protein [Pseudomonadota bacterium]NDC24473.1 hypothetical protein [Pseudomonadota bacterium]NDD04426.1 hypothetical protein [Pseudomonadota bacterium]NDG26125.1 hypothetical protein [Pseudomonadota bacterium]